jgi:hypothetical protein
LTDTAAGLEKSGLTMPAFGNIQNALATEMMEESTETSKKILITIEWTKKFLIKENLNKLRIIQTIVKMHIQRKKHVEKLSRYNQNVDSIITIQSLVKMRILRQKHLRKLSHYQKNQASIIKIQARVKGVNALQTFQNRLANFKLHEKKFEKV